MDSQKLWKSESWGTCIYVRSTWQKCDNLFGCIADNGLVCHTARLGGMNRQLFNDFLGEVGRRVNPDQQTFRCLTTPLRIEMQIAPEKELK